MHCYAGQSRSVALVLAYLCSALRMQLSDAYQLVRSTRPSARPNSGGALVIAKVLAAPRKHGCMHLPKSCHCFMRLNSNSMPHCLNNIC